MPLLIQLIAPDKELFNNGQTGDLLLADLNSQFLQVAGNGLPLEQQGATLSQKLDNSLGLHKIPILAFVLLAR
jgi:hypothetical protein